MIYGNPYDLPAKGNVLRVPVFVSGGETHEMPQLLERSPRNRQRLRILRKPAEISRTPTESSASSAILDGDSRLDMGMHWSRSDRRYRRAFDFFCERALFVCAGI
jgi:hypothetical protein